MYDRNMYNMYTILYTILVRVYDTVNTIFSFCLYSRCLIYTQIINKNILRPIPSSTVYK